MLVYQVIDGLLLVFAFWLSHLLRFCATAWFHLETPISGFNQFQWLVVIILPFGPIFLEMENYYVHPLRKSLLGSLRQIMQASMWLGLLVGCCILFLRLQVPSRAVVLGFMALGTLFLLLRERVTILRARAHARNGQGREPVLLAGTPKDTAALRNSLTPDQLAEMNFVGLIDIEKQPIADLVAALHHHSVSRVIFAGNHSHMNRLQEAIGACEIEGVEAWLMADFIKTSIAKPTFDVFASRPMLVFRTTPKVSWTLAIKTAMDRTGALIILLLSLPLLIPAMIGIWLTSSGPIIFRQQRAGRHGRPFVMLKLRTMSVDAEQRRSELEGCNEMSGPVFKVQNDPRITPLGRFLRKTSIDELPQLINILRGDMSLVGPRPLPVYEVEKFEHSAQRRRLSVKPGLTCLWQIGGRNNVKNFDDWVKLDLQYIDNWSIWLDIKILLKTVPAVLFGSGAK